MANVVYDNITLQYPGTDRPAVAGLALDIEDGEFLVLVGPSGCGKSTALRMLAGLEEVTDGRILIDDEDMTHVSPKDRDIAMVFQNYALYPHMTVAENMRFALKIAGVSKDERRRRVEAVAEQLDLSDYLDRKPKALSGGQRQRVAMGRAIVREPKVFLMDEPLSNRDAKLRVQTRSRIATLQRELGVTKVYVTHDQTEALTMGDRIAVMKLGVLQQVGTPRQLLDHPVNTFVAGFTGSPAMNLFTAEVTDDGVLFGNVVLPISVDVRAAIRGDRVVIGVRPEDLVVGPAGLESLQITATLIEELGADGYLFGTAPLAGDAVSVVARVDGRNHPEVGESVSALPVSERVHLFDPGSGRRIGSLSERG
ncbi:sn-glycerol-3-phosphate ABC transporter ATP-binding protein UgpC [Leucobacter sp. gxy201]|uniref:ABC transporter ATP-binding protein n=1 Tax=Leucobacter sp. gxy201 TaxID=2957200 RepID=UPI003DA19EA4